MKRRQQFYLRYFLTVATALLFSLTVAAQTSFSVQAPARVSVGDKFQVSFVLKNATDQASDLKAPQINGCQMLYGPVTSSQQNYSYVNGRSTSSSSTIFTYYYKATQEGTFNIGAASINVGGKKFTSKPTQLTIGPGNPDNNRPSAPARSTHEEIINQSTDRNATANDVFVRIKLSKTSAYEQEAIECTIKLYTSYYITQFIPTVLPGFDGFLVEDLNVTPELNAEETINGKIYKTAILKKCILFPQKSGKLTINSGNYDVDVVQYNSINMGFYTVNEPVERKIKITSNSASVDIKPLPADAPSSFDGAVGQFEASVRLSTENFRTNEPATLYYTIKGTGNLKFLKEADIDFPADFEQYAPQTTTDARIAGNTVSGTVTYEYTFVPREVGNYTIGIDDFSYFDPVKNEYVSIPLKSFDIKVNRGVSSASGAQQDIEARNTDIRHIHEGATASKSGMKFMITSPVYWGIYIVLLLILIIAVFVNNNKIRRMADVSGTRMAKASKVARKRLKLSEQLMKKNESEKFYEETLRAIWGYLSDKLSMPSSVLNRQNVAEALESRGASEALIEQFMNVLDTCELARYTPAGSQEELNTVYNQASEAINGLEKTKLNPAKSNR